MYQTQSKAVFIVGASILLLTTLTLLWTHPFYPPSRLADIHISTTSRKTVTFQQRREFMDLSESSDGNWTSLLPPNGGFTTRPSRGGDNYEMVGITMFHQLHCLQMLRTAIQDMVAGHPVGSRIDAAIDRRIPNSKSSSTAQHSGHEDLFGVRRRKRHGPHLDSEHYLHCFDYLLQGILCSADDTIEYGHEDEDGRRAVDGYEVVHQCRSADAIWAEVMGENSVPGWEIGTELRQ